MTENSEKKRQDDLVASLLFTIKKLARYRKSRNRSITLQTTEIVNEAYLKLAEQGNREWHNEGHFLAAFSETLRRFIVDLYRRKSAQKRGGSSQTIHLDGSDIELTVPDNHSDWLTLNDKLDALDKIDPLARKIVELRYFTGLNLEETAEAVGVSRKTVSRKWRFARSWLHSRLTLDEDV